MHLAAAPVPGLLSRPVSLRRSPKHARIVSSEFSSSRSLLDDHVPPLPRWHCKCRNRYTRLHAQLYRHLAAAAATVASVETIIVIIIITITVLYGHRPCGGKSAQVFELIFKRRRWSLTTTTTWSNVATDRKSNGSPVPPRFTSSLTYNVRRVYARPWL